MSEDKEPIRLTDEQRLDWLRLIRSQNVGPRGIMAQTPEEVFLSSPYLQAQDQLIHIKVAWVKALTIIPT